MILLLLLAADEVSGPVRYAKDGVELDGKKTAWKNLTKLTETDPDFEKLRAEYRAKKSDDPAALGKWCRDRGLEEEARKEFQRALELDSNHEAARKALGFARVKDGWKPASEVYADQERALQPLALADWCREHALFDEERKILASLLVADGWNRDAIRRFKPLVERRAPATPLRPPFEGRWLAVVDKTLHHQIKCWAITAIDFVRVDAEGRLYTGDAKDLEDFLAWDQPVYAAADGEVVDVQNDWPDLPPNKAGKFEEANQITIRHTDEEFTTYVHCRKGSAQVKVGDKLKKGQRIARVGNSGASGLPHLHFAMMTPVYSGGRGQYVGIPYRFENFTLVDVQKTKCRVDVRAARPQEGWTIEASRP